MFDKLIEVLKANPRKIVLPDGPDPRIVEAAARLKEGGFLTPVLIDPEAGTLEAADLSLPDEAVVEPSSEETYRMAFSDKALTIQPIGAYFSGRESSTDYVLTR